MVIITDWQNFFSTIQLRGMAKPLLLPTPLIPLLAEAAEQYTRGLVWDVDSEDWVERVNTPSPATDDADPVWNHTPLPTYGDTPIPLQDYLVTPGDGTTVTVTHKPSGAVRIAEDAESLQQTIVELHKQVVSDGQA